MAANNKRMGKKLNKTRQGKIYQKKKKKVLLSLQAQWLGLMLL